MKYEKYFEKYKIKDWDSFYVDYKILKKIIKSRNYDFFWKTIEKEIERVNLFCTHFRNNLASFEKINQYIILNYMAIFKAIKKYDKHLCKSSKFRFFDMIQKQPFYQSFLKQKREKNKIKCVIFDKDGTLIKLNNLFRPWLLKQLQALYLHITNFDEACAYLGYHLEKNVFDAQSVIVKGTNDDIRKKIAEYIYEKNPQLDCEYIRTFVYDNWIHIQVTHDNIETCGNLQVVMEYLKSKDIKIAVCTSDDRKPTIETLKMLELQKYIDFVVCGDDPISSKPSPEPIWKICGKLGVNPNETIMVGDTISDIHAGLHAKCAYILGVLTGGYESHELCQADAILESVNDLPEFINSKLMVHRIQSREIRKYI